MNSDIFEQLLHLYLTGEQFLLPASSNCLHLLHYRFRNLLIKLTNSLLTVYYHYVFECICLHLIAVFNLLCIWSLVCSDVIYESEQFLCGSLKNMGGFAYLTHVKNGENHKAIFPFSSWLPNTV